MPFSRLSQKESYRDAGLLKDLAAKALAAGRLRLILGAGVSRACELPDWPELVDRISSHYSLSVEGRELPEASQILLEKGARGDRAAFASVLREQLYAGYETSMEGLSNYPLLRALGAISMAGIRNGSTEILTFNFDDLLENYLRYHGFIVSSITTLPSLNQSKEVEILHPHGLLPVETAVSPSQVVFTAEDFEQVVGNTSDYWHQRAWHLLSSNFCLFIGLSGEDQRLCTLLSQVRQIHPILGNGDYYWGLRFTDDEQDPKKETFDRYRILQITTPHSEIPGWLLSVTQKAAAISQNV